MTYANPLWSNELPKGGFEYKIRHTGISARYDAFIQYPAVVGLCIPNGLKTYLNVFDSMNKQVQDFIVSHTKKCDGCRYCVQTDKTKSRPFVSIKINHNSKQYNLCPLIPGYSYCWTKIDNDLVDQIIEVLTFMDKFIPNNIQKGNIEQKQKTCT